MKRRDGDRASVPQRRRHPVLQTQGYSDQEMGSRIRGFPKREVIWSGSETPALVNPETPVRLIRSDQLAVPKTGRIRLLVNRQGNKVRAPGGIDALEAVIQVRRYRFRHILHESGLFNNERVKTVLDRRCYELTKHKQATSKQCIIDFTGHSVDDFRLSSYSYFESIFGKEVRAMVISHRKMTRALPSDDLLSFLKREQAIIAALEGAAQDARHVWGAVAAVFECNLKGSTPTLNSLHRVFRPEYAKMRTEDEFKSVLILLSFFGCTDAAQIYLEHIAFSELCRVASFLGRANLGLPEPTWKEAGAYLHLVSGLIDSDRKLPRVAEVDSLLEALKLIPDWDRYHLYLEKICLRKFYEQVPGFSQVLRKEQLWHMI